MHNSLLGKRVDLCKMQHDIVAVSGSTRHICFVLQVEVEIETMDRGGTFLGTLRIVGGGRPLNLGPALLEAGLAKLHPSFDPDRIQGGRELSAAQDHAQSARLKVCV